MNKEDYAQKLRDPRWQRKRLEIMSRDDWKCKWRSDDTSTLHVHHLVYIKGYEPWEYRDGLLVTLCKSCHEDETKTRYQRERSLLRHLKLRKFTSNDIYELIEKLRDTSMANMTPKSIIEMIRPENSKNGYNSEYEEYSNDLEIFLSSDIFREILNNEEISHIDDDIRENLSDILSDNIDSLKELFIEMFIAFFRMIDRNMKIDKVFKEL